ncbi:MAG: hypothetical protein QXI07_11180 [Pyrobaculum sp.]
MVVKEFATSMMLWMLEKPKLRKVLLALFIQVSIAFVVAWHINHISPLPPECMIVFYIIGSFILDLRYFKNAQRVKGVH